jgi:peptide-methionine (S)-S-oxide reductase
VSDMAATDRGNLQTATLGGGCFWCLDAVYRDLRGVESVESGYAGGTVPNPSYELVCTGRTGHAEVVRLGYDPDVVDYRTLLEVFFAIHDPTTPDRQGADVGPQYRSIILTESDEQKRLADEIIRELDSEDVYGAPIVTQVEPLEVFYPGERYHQDYLANNPRQPYCQAVVAPKLAKFRQKFAALRKTASVS